MALCPQEPDAILFADTVADEVRVTLRAPRTATSRRPSRSWTRSASPTLAARHPRDLSAGQRLLVATAAVAAAGAPRAAARRADAGAGPGSQGRLARFLRAHAARGGAVMFATHDVELAAAVATRVVMLAGGEIIADGDPGTVLGDSHVFAPQMTRAFGPGLAHARAGRGGAGVSAAVTTAPTPATSTVPSRGAIRPARTVRIAVLIAVNLLGVLAFVWPFVLPLAPGVNENHRRTRR